MPPSDSQPPSRSKIRVTPIDNEGVMRHVSASKVPTKEAPKVLRTSLSAIERILDRSPRGAETRPAREIERKALHAHMTKARVRKGTLAGFYRSLAVWLDGVVCRKDLQRIAIVVASQLPEDPAVYVAAEAAAAQLKAIEELASRIEDPVLRKRLLAAGDRKAPSIRPRTERELEELILAIYNSDPRPPYLDSRDKDLAWLKERFWRDGQPRIQKHEHRAPRRLFFNAFRSGVAALLREDLKTTRCAARYASKILTLHVVDSGLLVDPPYDLAFTEAATRTGLVEWTKRRAKSRAEAKARRVEDKSAK